MLSFAVITAVQTKLMWYILYVYPFAALIVGVLTRDLVTLFRNKSRIAGWVQQRETHRIYLYTSMLHRYRIAIGLFKTPDSDSCRYYETGRD